MATTEAEAPVPDSAEIREILAKMAEFAQLLPQPGSNANVSIDFLRDVPITISAQLGHTVMPIGEILRLGPGAIVELSEPVDQPIQLMVRGVPFATAEVVVVEDRFAVRIKSLLAPRGGKRP